MSGYGNPRGKGVKGQVAPGGAKGKRRYLPRDFKPELPMFERRLAYGIALRQNGYSYRAAAEESGCNESTLWNRCKQLSQPDMEGMISDAIGMAHDIMQESGRQTHEALREGRISDQQLPIVYGIATDKISRLSTAMKGAQTRDGLGEVLGRLANALGDSKVELTIEPAAVDAKAIDVTPSGDSEG
jgi:lambda repressor-like predicted transcriptional regulator